MRIWVIGRGLPTKENNMLGSFELEQAQMLARHGHAVCYPVLDIRSLRHRRRIGVTKKQDHGVETITLNIPIGRILPKRIRDKIALWLKRILFRNVIRKYGQPEIVHVHYPSLFSFSPFKLTKESGTKLVITEHFTKVQNKTLSERCLRNLKDWVANSDAVCCVGEWLAASIRELTGTKKEITVVPNVVPHYFRYVKSEITDSCFRFIGVGRLVECKRFDLMIEAFCAAFKGINDIRLEIVGDGVEREKLLNRIKQLSCEEQVTLHGVMDREELARYYHQCDVLIMASNLETFGVPIIEAMASGLPVVTTDAMGFQKQFHHEQGIIIPADDLESMTNALIYIYNNYDQYDKFAISNRAKQCFGESAIVHRLESIYKSVNNP